ncbi:YybH family protein [Actinomycetospora sp. C-140]
MAGRLRRGLGAYRERGRGAMKDLLSHGEDVTVLGAFGGYARGRESVATRLDWASSQFQDGRWSSEDVAAHVTDDLACTVMIERTEARVGRDAEPSLQELRVTHVLRREGEEFKIVHRHADPPLTARAP